MSGSYLGHGAKYWAEKYYELLENPRLDLPSPSEKLQARCAQLEKSASLYQAQVADLRTEVAYLRSQAEFLQSAASVQGHDAEYWCSAYCDLDDDLAQLKDDYKKLQEQYQDLESEFKEQSSASTTYEGYDAEYWYQKYAHLNRISSSQAPECIRTLVACLWIIPGLLLVYLLQNLIGVVFLHTSFILLFFCGILSDSAYDFPGGRFVLQIALVPYIASFFMYLSPFHLKDFFSFVFVYTGLTLSGAAFYFIPLYILRFICQGLVFITDFLFRYFSRKGPFFRFVSSCAAIIMISALIFSFPPFRITFFPSFSESLFESESVVYVWIPSKGGERYHCSKFCSGMVNPKKVLLEEALERGYFQCGNCYR